MLSQKIQDKYLSLVCLGPAQRKHTSVFFCLGPGSRRKWFEGCGRGVGAFWLASMSCRKELWARREAFLTRTGHRLQELVLSADMAPCKSTQSVTATFATNASTCCVASQNAPSELRTSQTICMHLPDADCKIMPRPSQKAFSCRGITQEKTLVCRCAQVDPHTIKTPWRRRQRDNPYKDNYTTIL